MGSLDNTDFKKLVSQQKTIQMKMRLMALELFKRGKSRTQIAKDLQVSRTSVNKWVRLFFGRRARRPSGKTKTRQAGIPHCRPAKSAQAIHKE